jgi:phosphatidylinositol alpha-mannosyltransferase
MAAGLAVVSSDALPPARVLRETNAGLLFRSGDGGSLADALLRLRSPDLRKELAEAGRRAVSSKYNWETDVARLLDALAGLCSAPHALSDTGQVRLRRKSAGRAAG